MAKQTSRKRHNLDEFPAETILAVNAILVGMIIATVWITAWAMTVVSSAYFVIATFITASIVLAILLIMLFSTP